MITDEEVGKIATLARLNLTADERAKYASELSKILEHVQQLNKFDVNGVEPLSHVHGSTNVFRSDLIEPSLSFEGEIAQNAPDKSGRFFRVPLVVE